MHYHSIFDPNWIAHIWRKLVTPFALAFLVLYDVRFLGIVVLMLALNLWPSGRGRNERMNHHGNSDL